MKLLIAVVATLVAVTSAGEMDKCMQKAQEVVRKRTLTFINRSAACKEIAAVNVFLAGGDRAGLHTSFLRWAVQQPNVCGENVKAVRFTGMSCTAHNQVLTLKVMCGYGKNRSTKDSAINIRRAMLDAHRLCKTN